MAGELRSRGVTYGQLVLFAALLFGIVTMHTVGHPAEHGGPSSSPAVMSGEHGGPASSAGAAGHATAGAREAVPAPPGVDAPHPPSHGFPASDAGVPPSGMDPLSVCLAVLGAWGLALLAARLLLGLRADGRSPGAPAKAGLLRAPRPNPPPPIPVLAAVSVLRV
ncbi:hypothetical protein ACFV2V_09670 [Streptomyces sp. NPDC059698]|uniref:hypothetical protein n=2 Tax=Streptomyces TaxID=1883 RepID=UPI00093F9FAE|nr:hypothetical protein [Streptomyces sp. CB02366]OKJ37013.1 hypothetical protein AMK24_16080 [Streptomyces sp. CB02366]WSS55193.1 hypothetical protein OG543_07235 [Streptomyces sp. NBC_01178]